MKWFNYIGLNFIAAITVPNVVFAFMHKEGFKNYYNNKFVEVLEQIGRVGCFLFMIVNIPSLTMGYLFNWARLAYIIFGSGCVLIYVLGWIIFWKKSSVTKSLLLSVVPSLLFLCCGVFILNIPLVVSAAIFAPCHIYISYKNAVVKDEEKAI